MRFILIILMTIMMLSCEGDIEHRLKRRNDDYC